MKPCCRRCTAFRWRLISSTATASSSPAGRPEATAMLNTVWLFKDALYGALVIALACSVLGVYVVLRRIVFFGAAMAQLSSAANAPPRVFFRRGASPVPAHL